MVGLNDFRRQWSDTGSDVLQAVAAVGESGWYILGRKVQELETALAAYWRIPYCVGVASGLDAIELSLRALECGAHDYVLTSPISAFATTLAILKLGATPVFADCDSNGLIDLDSCARVLAARPEIRYFVPVHLYGQSIDLAGLRALRDRFELNLVEDCAQSIGAAWNGTPTGSVGQFAATSFYPTKNLGALGDGGAVLTHTAEHAAEVRRLRDYGQNAKYVHEVVGYNSRLDELQAAILKDAFLPRLETWIATRKRIAGTYLAGISSPAIACIPGSGGDSSWHLFPVLIDEARKAEFLHHLKEKGILAGEHYPRSIPEQPAIEGKVSADCPHAIRFCRREVSLPIHPYLTEEEVAAVIQACNGWS